MYRIGVKCAQERQASFEIIQFFAHIESTHFGAVCETDRREHKTEAFLAPLSRNLLQEVSYREIRENHNFSRRRSRFLDCDERFNASFPPDYYHAIDAYSEVDDGEHEGSDQNT